MHLQYLHIASRLVWQNNVSLANKILFKNVVIGDMSFVKGDKVLLKDPNLFSLKFAQYKLDAATTEMTLLQKSTNSSGPIFSSFTC